MVKIYDDRIIVSASQYGTYWKEYINVTDSSLANSGKVGVIGLASMVDVLEMFVSPYIYPEPTSSLDEAVQTQGNSIMFGHSF